MAGNIIELHTEVPAELEANVFGQFDEHLKLIERTLNVTVISRDGILKILGNEQNAASAKKLIEELTVLAKRGNTITKQNVNYALSLAMEQRNEVLTEIDKDFICNTIQGRPIKPKTLGQKDYVEQIRKKMIVFGVGPAGTGKTRAGQRLRRTASHSSMHTQSKTARAVARRANAGRPCSKKRSCEGLAFTTSSIFSQAATPNVQPMASSWRFARTAAAARVRNTAISRYRSCMRCAKQKMPAA